MPITPDQIQQAQAVQHTAAHDASRQVRVVAGPGTGKSFAIEERVRWLLEQGVDPTAIWGVSFTRAAARDLRDRVHAYCSRRGLPMAEIVRVSTLHSLALRALRAARLLEAYPTEPLVLDQWELENVFDAEFGQVAGLGEALGRPIPPRGLVDGLDVVGLEPGANHRGEPGVPAGDPAQPVLREEAEGVLEPQVRRGPVEGREEHVTRPAALERLREGAHPAVLGLRGNGQHGDEAVRGEALVQLRVGEAVVVAPALRVWSDWDAFAATQAPKGDLRTARYKTSKETDEGIMADFAAQTAAGQKRKGGRSFEEFRLQGDYDLRTNNCTPICLGAMGGAQRKTGARFTGYEGFKNENDPRDLYGDVGRTRGGGVTVQDTRKRPE